DDRGHGDGGGCNLHEYQWLARSSRAATYPRLSRFEGFMQLIRILFAFALLFTLVPAQADQAASTQRLTGLLKQADTLTGRFSQLSLDGTGTQLQETSGELALKRPGQFRWHTD